MQRQQQWEAVPRLHSRVVGESPMQSWAKKRRKMQAVKNAAVEEKRTGWYTPAQKTWYHTGSSQQERQLLHDEKNILLPLPWYRVALFVGAHYHKQGWAAAGGPAWRYFIWVGVAGAEQMPSSHCWCCVGKLHPVKISLWLCRLFGTSWHLPQHNL